MSSAQPRSAPMTDDEVVEHYRAGTLLRELHRPATTAMQEELHVQLAALHNKRRIDLLAWSVTPEFEKADRRYFLTIQQVYRNAIPHLEIASSDMLELIRRIEGRIGGLSVFARGVLPLWIKGARSRSQEIVDLARSDIDFDRDVLLQALVAIGDADVANSFITVTDTRRQAAIAALGAIKPRNVKSGDATLSTLIAIVLEDPDDNVRFTAISAALNLLVPRKMRAPKSIPALIDAATARPSEEIRTALLNGLWRHPEVFGSADAKAVLSSACDGDLTSDRLVDMLGAALSGLVGGTHHDQAIDCLSALLASSGKVLPLDRLQALDHHLTTLERPVLFAIAVRWFGTGDPALCQATSRLIGVVHDQKPFDESLKGFGLTGDQTVVLCHKAVGYMPLAPIVATSFIVAALRVGDRDAESKLVELLFEALLINFGETVAHHLKKISKADAAYRPVRAALKIYRRYERDLNIETPLKELQPSDYQRSVVRQNRYVTNREIRKQAERQSVFFGTVHRSNVLYGRKVISYARGAGEPPTSMELREMSGYIEMPRLQTIDPVGLNWLLYIFKSSKPK
jgi:HEAT repeats